jgi:NADPH:quinone reductase
LIERENLMRAVGYFKSGPITEAKALENVEVPEPVAGEFDVIVDVKAISVNPVDYKVRLRAPPTGTGPKVIGFDAAGVVRSAGKQAAQLFKPGDEVYYAGAINRQGSNAERQAVDARIVGRKPKSLDWAEAAALPLTTITAWEMLLGSIAIQLARQLTALTVIATASRPESDAWCRAMGAHHVVDHSKPLAPQLAALKLGAPGFVFCTSNSGPYMADIAALIAPQGRLGLIADTADIAPLKNKSVSIHWEFMFTRPVEGTADISEQAQLLNEAARLIDGGKLHTTLTRRLGTITAANLIEAHKLLEEGRMLGKLALEGF